MVRATVPEAAVDEHSHTHAREDDVGLAAESGYGSAVLEEAKARTVKGRPQGDLWRRVPWAVRLHRPPYPGAARPRLHLHTRMVPDGPSAWRRADDT